MLPWAVHRVEEADDWQPLVQTALVVERLFTSSLATGVLLTVQCSEHMGFDAEAALERGAAALIGNYRLEQQLQGCAAWPHEPRPALGNPAVPRACGGSRSSSTARRSAPIWPTSWCR